MALFDRLSVALFAVLAAIVLTAFRDFGVAWDDPFHEHYGNLILRYLATWGADRSVLEFRNLGLYGGLFDAPTALLARALPFEPFQSRHLAIAVTGLIGIWGAWAMARRLGGPQAGFWAALLLAATPSYFGHMFVNPKDIPFAAATIWALYFAARAAALLPGLNFRILLGLGAAVGAAMGVRIGGVVLIGYLGLLVLLHIAWGRGRAAHPIGAARTVRVLLQAAGIFVWPCLVLTFVLWPAAWPWLFDQAIVALWVTAKFAAPVEVLFQGQAYSSLDLPIHYVPGHLAVKLPLVLLALSTLAIPFAAARFVRAWTAGEREPVFGTAALVLGIGFPVVFAMVRGSAHYDGIRHFLFVLPPLAVFAAIEWSRLLEVLWRRREVLAWGAGLVAGLGVAVSVFDMARLHPYEYTDYNALAGGVHGAEGRYELDYWALSYREAAQRLRALPAVTGRGGVKVYVCGPADSAARFLPKRFVVTDAIFEADFFLSLTRWGCDMLVDAPVVFEIERMGARLSVVKDLRAGYAQTGELPKQIRIIEDYPRHGEEN